MLGAGRALPFSPVASLHAEIMGGKVSLGQVSFLTCFFLESRMSLNIAGSCGRSAPHPWFGAEEENPKCVPSPVRTGLSRSAPSPNYLPPLSLVGASAPLAGGWIAIRTALPFLGCSPVLLKSQFINPDLVRKITERENNKSGLLAVPALKLPSPRQASQRTVSEQRRRSPVCLGINCPTWLIVG